MLSMAVFFYFSDVELNSVYFNGLLCVV